MGKYKTFGSRFDRVHRNDLNANFADIETDINAQKTRVDDLIIGTPQPSEVVDSRGGFPVLGDRLEDLSSSLAQKLTKGEGGSVTWAMAAQDFREQITGGNTAVVGVNAVLKENIVNGAVAPEKTDFLSVKPTNLYNPNKATNGIRLNADGTFLSDATYSLSEMIPVVAGKTYVTGFGQPNLKSSRIGGYNPDGTFLKIVDNNGFTSSSTVLVREFTADFTGFVRVPFAIDGKQWAIVAEKVNYKKFEPFSYLLSENIIPKVPESSVNTVNLIDDSVTFEKANFLTYSKNLFDISKVSAGFYVNQGSGLLTAFDGHFASDFILVKSGQTYTISTARKFAQYTVDKVFISGLDLNNAPYTFTASQDGFIRFSYTTEYNSNVQMEIGNTVTSYEVFGFYNMPNLKFTNEQKNELTGASTAPTKDLEVVKLGESFDIKTPFDDKTLTIKTVRNGSANGAFTFIETWVNDEVMHTNGDDITPIRTFTTVGANHGYPNIVVVSLSGHGKTSVDLGSKWTDGTTVYTLLLISGNNLTFGCPYTVVDGVTTSVRVSPVANLTHVSGATNTSAVAISNILASQQLYPSVKNVSVKYMLDGKEITTNGSHKGDILRVVESYDILDYKDIIDFAQQNIGTSYVNGNVGAIVSFAIVYTFKRGGKCTISHTFKAHKKVSIKNCGFIQAAPLNNSSYALKRYMPNVLEKSGYDFSNIVDMATYSTDLNFAASSLTQPSIPPHRYVDLLKNGADTLIGYTMGYIPDKTNSKHSDRLVNTGIYWDMRGTKKVYPVAMSEKTFEAGEYKTFMAYRNYLSPNELNTATCVNVVEDNQAVYVYIDYHTSVTAGSVRLSSSLIGKSITIIESSNFVLLNDVVDAEGVTFNVNTKGFAVLKIA
jgi:hypothetical protein